MHRHVLLTMKSHGSKQNHPLNFIAKPCIFFVQREEKEEDTTYIFVRSLILLNANILQYVCGQNITFR